LQAKIPRMIRDIRIKHFLFIIDDLKD